MTEEASEPYHGLKDQLEEVVGENDEAQLRG